MPYLNIQTNISLDESQRESLMSRSSSLVAEVLGKPEEYVMISLKDSETMYFAGSSKPLAFLELKSIGLQSYKTKEFAQAFCEFAAQELQIPGKRIYVKFNDAQRSMWGWNGATFA